VGQKTKSLGQSNEGFDERGIRERVDQ
jgi:hypothetical protein